jgi:pimeloyl-ACP methyl ester carboxylesterase
MGPTPRPGVRDRRVHRRRLRRIRARRARRPTGEADARRDRRRVLGFEALTDVRAGGAIEVRPVLLCRAQSDGRVHDRLPAGHRPGSALALAISLHGFGGNHASGLGDVTLSQALAAREHGRGLPPMALVSVDGGGLYWNPHPGDDPMAMIVHELIPMCQRLGLGRSPHGIGAIGISMGGYGALLLAEKNPGLIAAVAAISPAVWTTSRRPARRTPARSRRPPTSPVTMSSPTLRC